MKVIKTELPRKSIKVADLDLFEVHAFVPIYRQLYTTYPNYFIDNLTGENIGQVLSLVIMPDGTYEKCHHSLVKVDTDQTIPLSGSEIPFTKEFLKLYNLDKIKELIKLNYIDGVLR